MRTLGVNFRGREIGLVPNWRASVEIAQKVGDPLFIRNEILRAHILQEAGADFERRFEFSADNVSKILAIAFVENGHSVTTDEVGEWMIEVGLNEAEGLAADFIGLMNEAGPAEPIEEDLPEKK